MPTLAEIRQTLVDTVAPFVPGFGADRVLYEGEQFEQVPADQTAARIEFGLPSRRQVGHDGAPLIEMTGRFAVEWSFPAMAGVAPTSAIAEATAALWRERVLPDDVWLAGDVQITRPSEESGRTRWRVETSWIATRREIPTGPMIAEPPDFAAALLAIRTLWQDQVEQPDVGAGWPGLTTCWDQGPKPMRAPALPWAGYWIAGIESSSVETRGNQQQRGRVLIQMHAEPRGIVPTLELIERVIAQHNRTYQQVQIGPVDLLAQQRSRAATLQTNLRIPFRFERPRP